MSFAVVYRMRMPLRRCATFQQTNSSVTGKRCLATYLWPGKGNAASRPTASGSGWTLWRMDSSSSMLSYSPLSRSTRFMTSCAHSTSLTMSCPNSAASTGSETCCMITVTATSIEACIALGIKVMIPRGFRSATSPTPVLRRVAFRPFRHRRHHSFRRQHSSSPGTAPLPPGSRI